MLLKTFVLDNVSQPYTKILFIEMIQGLEHLSYKNRMKELGLFSLEDRRFQDDPIAAVQCLTGG